MPLTNNGGNAEDSAQRKTIIYRQYFVIPAKEGVKKLAACGISL